MKLEDLQGLSVEDQFKKAAAFSGVGADVLDRQWQVESGRGRNLVGPETKWGRAKGHFQFLDSTHAEISKRLGFEFDRNDFTQALLGAAYLWKENMDMQGGDVNAATAAYHAGPNRKQWGPVTADYVRKVAGGDIPAASVADGVPDVPNVPDMDDIADAVGREALTAIQARDKADVALAATRAAGLQKTSAAEELAETQRRLELETRGDLMGAAYSDQNNNYTYALLDAVNRQTETPPPDWDYNEVLNKDIVRLGLTGDEIDLLKEQGVYGPESHQTAVTRVLADRERAAEYQKAGALPTLGASIFASVTSDPVAAVSGLAVVKAFQLAKIGSGALIAAGRPGAAVGSAFAEAAVGNVGIEAAVDLMGEKRSAEDYLMAAGMSGMFYAPFARGTYRQAANVALEKRFDEMVGDTMSDVFVGPLSPAQRAAREKLEADAEINRGRVTPPPLIPKELADEFDENGGINPPEEIPAGEATEVELTPEEQAVMADAVATNRAIQEVYAKERQNVADFGPQAGVQWADKQYLEVRRNMAAGGGFDDHINKATAGEMTYADLARKPAGVYLTKTAQAVPELADTFKFADSLIKRFMPDSKIVLTDRVTSNGLAEVFSANDTHIIGVRSNLPPEQQRMSLVHEVGHVIWHEYASKVDPATLFRLREDFAKFMDLYRAEGQAPAYPGSTMGGKARGLRTAVHLTDKPSSRTKGLPFPLQGDKITAADKGAGTSDTLAYIANQDEFTAEQFVKFISQQMLKGKIDYIEPSLMQTIIEGIRKLMEMFKASGVVSQFSPEQSYADFFQSVMDSVTQKAQESVEFLDPSLVLPDVVAAQDAVSQMASVGGGINPGAVISAKHRFAERLRQHADSFLKANPIDSKKLNVLTRKVAGAVSTGVKLASSEHKLAKMFAATVAEITTGAAGRRPTVALRADRLKKTMMGDGLTRYSVAYESWRGRNGGSLSEDLFNGRKRREFDRAVMVELVSRREVSPVLTNDPSIKAAADAMEAGFERARQQQVSSNVLGAANLPTTARGYVPQSLNGRMLAQISNTDWDELVEHLGHRFASVYGWDPSVSRDIARTYMTREKNRAQRGDSFALPSDDPANPIKEALLELKGAVTGQNLDAILKAELAFSDRGLGQTKKRLDVGLLEKLPSGKLVLDYYDDNPAMLYQRYMHRTAGSVAFTEFGINGPVGLRLYREAMQIPTENGDIVTPEELDAFDQIVAELMGTPVEGAKISEAALAARLLVGTQRLGSLVFTQAAEMFNMLHHLGLSSLLSANLNLPKMVSEVGRLKKGLPSGNRLLTSIETMAGEIGMEGFRLRMPLDAPDDRLIAYSNDAGLVTRALQGASHLQAKISFFRGLMAAQHRAVAEQIVLKAVRYIRDANAQHDVYLADMGFTTELVKTMRQSHRWYKLAPDGRVIDLDVSAIPDANAREAFIQSVHRGVGQIIQHTFVGERNAWVHNDYAQLLLQLRTFGITAMEKQWARTVNNSGYAKAAGIVLGQMALAMPIHLARVHAQAALMGDEEKKKYVESNTNPGALVRASMNYASTSALFGDAWELGAAVAAGWVDDPDFNDTVGVRGGTGGATSRAVPIVGSIDQAAQVLSGKGSLYQALKQLPGSNLWFIAPIIGLTKDD
jgi:hypothetical protein